MAVKLVWSPQAEDDVINTYVEIGLHQPQAAERYYEQFRQKVGLLAEARWCPDFRPAVLGVPVEHRSRGRPAGASQGQGHALQKSSEHDIYAGPSTRYCPAGVCEWVEKDGQETYVINAPELRPMQDLRHQGSQPEYQLGSAAGWRRAGLSEYVTVSSTLPPTWQASGSLTVTRGQHSH